MHSTSKQFAQSAASNKPLPGYTGHRPQYINEAAANAVRISPTRDANSRIPGMHDIRLMVLGYSGYIPGVKAENVFGESYGKATWQSSSGEIIRGYD